MIDIAPNISKQSETLMHLNYHVHTYSSPDTNFCSILCAVALPYGMYDSVYHKLAAICTSSNNTNNPILGPVGMGMKQTVIEHANETKYVIDVAFLFSSNMLLNCRLGPDRNMDDMSESMLPEEYKKTNGAGFPSTSLMKRRKDMKVIR